MSPLYTPAALLKPKVQSTLFANIVEAYKAIGKPEEQALHLIQRTQLPGLCADYGVIEDLRDDVRAHDYFVHSEDFAGFEKFVAMKRNEFQRHEIEALNRKYQALGGRLVFESDGKLETYVSAVHAGLRIVEGGAAVVSEYFGEIDPRTLNLGFSAFPDGAGQVAFTSALAVATGKYDFSISRLPKIFGDVGENRKKQNWKNLPCDWRRIQAIRSDKTAFLPGLEGYKLFAKLYADGEMGKAFVIASALLGDDFAKLKWGSCIQLHVDEVDTVQTELREAITSPDPKHSLKKFEGYKNFARENFCKGQMGQAFQIASALLGDDFAKLKWGSQIQLHVDEVGAVQTELREAITSPDPKHPLKNFEGYKNFARKTFCKGQMRKAFQIASALLGEDFAKLKWGSQIHLHVDEVDAVQTELRETITSSNPNHSLKGFEGYKNFARKTFCKGQMIKAFHIASALLGDDFAKLKWGSQIQLHVDEVEKVKAALEHACIAGSWRGISGFQDYVRFAGTKSYSAFLNACALIGRDTVKGMAWPKQEDILSEQKRMYARVEDEIESSEENDDDDHES